ncbi:glycoside hydrolase superfamily, partial [Pseudomassariella vexata]
MHFTRSLAAAALSAAPVLATKSYKVNTYWGQAGVGDTLGQYCESTSIDYITLGFVNNSPEHGNGTHYPGTNFAAHCAADVYVKNGQNSKLLSGCSFIKDDIKKCQTLGKKVLLSIGGEMNWQSDYSVSSVAEGEYFAQFMFEAFGPFQSGYEGPRPFDIGEYDHTCVDGFDFDIKTKFADQQPYIAMINKLRELINNYDEDIILTAAPQCPLSTQYFQMDSILAEAQFDKIWIQFYNNEGCDATTEAFNYDDWETFIETTANKDAELYIGLPGSPNAAASGYITPEAAKTLICDYRSKAHFGGVMLRDAYYASQNIKDSKTYYDSIHEALQYGACDGDAISSSSYVVSSTTSSNSSSHASSTVSETYSGTSNASSTERTTSYPISSTTLSAPFPTITVPPYRNSSFSIRTRTYTSSSTSSDDNDDYCTDDCDDETTAYSVTTTYSYPATESLSSSSYAITSSTTAPETTSNTLSYGATPTITGDSLPEDETSSSYTMSETSSYSATTTYGASETTTYGISETTTYGASETSTYGISETTTYGASETSAYGISETTTYGASETSTHGISETTTYGASETSAYGISETTTYGASDTFTYGISETTTYGASDTFTYG